MNQRRAITLAGVLAALALNFLPWGRDWTTSRSRLPRQFAVPAPAMPATPRGLPSFHEEILGPGAGVVSVHVASLCEPRPGQLAAAWYGGSREGARDVAIYFTLRTNALAGGWSEPVPVVTAASAQRELDRFVRKVGNALLYSDGRGRLSLLYVSIAVGGWSGSTLNLKESVDDGRTWTPSRRLVLSPFFNLCELVKNPPVPLVGGGWAVPVYQELFGKFPEILWLDGPDAAAPASCTRVFGGRTAFQPTLVALDAQRALMLCRTAGWQRDLFVSRTEDAGARWTAPVPSGLPNPDAGIVAIRLADGRLLLAFNDATSGRDNLRLALSEDSGATWRRVATVASEPGAEFSYPFLLQTRDEQIHLAYTWKRQAIRLVTFNPAWLDAQKTEITR